MILFLLRNRSHSGPSTSPHSWRCSHSYHRHSHHWKPSSPFCDWSLHPDPVGAAASFLHNKPEKEKKKIECISEKHMQRFLQEMLNVPLDLLQQIRFFMYKIPVFFKWIIMFFSYKLKISLWTTNSENNKDYQFKKKECWNSKHLKTRGKQMSKNDLNFY